MKRGVKFRLFRSRAFWFGVPGLVFLLWGWWVSMGHLSVASYGSGRNEWMIGQSAGELVMGWNWDGGQMSQGLNGDHLQMPPGGEVEWRVGLARYCDSDVTLRFVFIPFQWPVLGYVAVWAGLLIWRKRKFENRPVE